ncbi:hypothetical protein SGPA1_20987 [Streptomyces misionensis JCM 4497]
MVLRHGLRLRRRGAGRGPRRARLPGGPLHAQYRARLAVALPVRLEIREAEETREDGQRDAHEEEHPDAAPLHPAAARAHHRAAAPGAQRHRRTGGRAGQPGTGQGRLLPAHRGPAAGPGRPGALRRHGGPALLRPRQPRRRRSRAAHHRRRIPVVRVRREHSHGPADPGLRDELLDEQLRPPCQHPQLLLQEHRRRGAQRHGRTLVDPGLRHEDVTPAARCPWL